jgi:glycosyltransferase involved in cell wall biosynthesis
MNVRVALLPGTRLSDPTYSRALIELSSALRGRGVDARAFCPRAQPLSRLRRFRPTVVNLHFSGRLGACAARWLDRAARDGASLAVTFQDLDHPDHPAPTAAERARVAALVGRARAVVALTPQLAREVRRRYPGARKISVVGNAVGASWFRRGSRRDGPITCVARLAPYKGIDVLLWAFADLAAADAKARLAVYGEDFSAGRFQRLAARLGLARRVSFEGPVAEARLRRALSRAPLVVSASRRETYGMAVLEALACGAPVLSTRCGAAPSLLAHGRSGWLVAPGDPRALSRALRRLWDDGALRVRLGKAGRGRARAQTWDDRARRYERLFGALS